MMMMMGFLVENGGCQGEHTSRQAFSRKNMQGTDGARANNHKWMPPPLLLPLLPPLPPPPQPLLPLPGLSLLPLPLPLLPLLQPLLSPPLLLSPLPSLSVLPPPLPGHVHGSFPPPRHQPHEFQSICAT